MRCGLGADDGTLGICHYHGGVFCRESVHAQGIAGLDVRRSFVAVRSGSYKC